MDIKTLRELDEQLRVATNALKSFEATLAACGDTKLQCLLKTCSATDLERASDALWMVAEQQFDFQLEKSTILQPVSTLDTDDDKGYTRNPAIQELVDELTLINSTRKCEPEHFVMGTCFCVHCLG